MKERPRDDKHWPLLWHLPGTLIRQNESIKQAYRRLITTEVGVSASFGNLQFVGIKECLKGTGDHQCCRGHEMELIHVVTFKGRRFTRGGRFFPIQSLHPLTIPFHHGIIKIIQKFIGD